MECRIRKHETVTAWELIIQKGVSGIVLHSAEIGAVLNDGAAKFGW
jgi:hypothetical protein